jgi:four helix bundle protein
MITKNLSELEIYQLSKELSRQSWDIYQKIPKYLKISFGNQFLSAIDSIGANIAEGYGRYHYKDSLKFFYYSRGSLWESSFWLELLLQREFIDMIEYEDFKKQLINLSVKLNNFIQSLRSKLTQKEN